MNRAVSAPNLLLQGKTILCEDKNSERRQCFRHVLPDEGLCSLALRTAPFQASKFVDECLPNYWSQGSRTGQILSSHKVRTVRLVYLVLCCTLRQIEQDQATEQRNKAMNK